VLNYVQIGIERTLGANNMRVYAVSARQALAAKARNDDAGLAESGLNRLEDDLSIFLATERGHVFLAAMLDRAARLVADGDGLEDIHATMLALRSHLIADKLLDGDVTAPAPHGVIRTATAPKVTPARSEGSQDRLLLEGVSCPICLALGQALQNFFIDLQYNIVVSAEARQELAEQHGFCCQHTWHFQGIASPQGISEGYTPLIDAALATLRRLDARRGTNPSQPIAEFLANPETCPACRLVRDLSRQLVPTLLSQLAVVDGRERYARGRGLCLPHLHAALSADPPAETAAFLVRSQVRRLEEISEDMRSYILKREALRRGLHNRDEENAWRRALVQLVGERNAYTPTGPASSIPPQEGPVR